MADESSRPATSDPRPGRRLLAHVVLGSVAAMAMASLWTRGGTSLDPSAPDTSPVLARVGDEVVTEAEFLVRWNELLTPEARRFHRGQGGPRNYLEEVVEEILLAREARRRGLHRRLDVREAMRAEADHALSRPLLAEEVRGKAIAPPEIRAYFDAHVAEWSKPTRVEVAEILVRKDLHGEGARARADELRRRALAGEDFAELARESSDAPTARYGGKVGWVTAGQFAKAYEAAALALAPGETSEVVETEDGFVILRASAREEGGGPTLEEKQADILRTLLEEDPGALSRRYVLFVDALRKSDSVQVDEAALERLASEGRLEP